MKRRDFAKSLVATALAGAALPTRSEAAAEVKVGAPLVLSGSTAEIGQTALQGLEMAVDDLNAKGGLLASRIAIVKGDDGGSPATANTLTRNMILTDGVKAIFGASNSATGSAEEALAGRYRVPMLFYGGNDISTTTTNFNKYAFQTQATTYMEPRAIALYVAKLNLKRVFTITPDYNFGRSYVSNFIAGLKENGITPDVVGQQYPPLGTTDFSSYISAALSAKPDFLFLGIFAGDLVTFIRQAKGYGLFGKVMTGGPTATDTILAMKGDTPAGMILWGRAPFFAMHGHGIEAFVADYNKKFKAWPSEWPILAYASVQIWAAGVKKAGTLDGTRVADALSGATIDTIRGDLTFRTCDHQANASTYIGKVAVKVDPKYGFPLLEDVSIIGAAKTMMSCKMAESLQHR
ncbi:MAG: ABC transporter substrate-binding protein [Acetobacteraceae bacterium]